MALLGQTFSYGKAGNVCDTLENLRAKIKSISPGRSKVNEDNIAIDLLQYCKSKEFDPKVPISVRF